MSKEFQYALIFCFLINVPFHLKGQNFNGKADLPAIAKNGFYSVLLVPRMQAYIKADFSDVRVFSDKDEEIPYIVKIPKGDLTIFNRDSLSGKCADTKLFSPLPQPKMTIKNTGKLTILQCYFPEQVKFDVLNFEIVSPEHYRREFFIDTLNSYVHAKFSDNLAYFVLSSNESQYFITQNFRTDTLNIVIRNKDDKPLEIKKLNFFCRNVYLIAQLDKDSLYRIVFGNSNINAPQYDLAFFPEKIPGKTTNILPENIVIKYENFNQKIKKDSEQENDIRISFVWIIIVLVILFIGFFTIKIVKENSSNKSNK